MTDRRDLPELVDAAMGFSDSTGRLRAALSAARWTAADLAREAMVDERTVRRWVAGAYQPPERIVLWAEGLATFIAAHPIPVRE